MPLLKLTNLWFFFTTLLLHVNFQNFFDTYLWFNTLLNWLVLLCRFFVSYYVIFISDILPWVINNSANYKLTPTTSKLLFIVAHLPVPLQIASRPCRLCFVVSYIALPSHTPLMPAIQVWRVLKVSLKTKQL